MGLPWRETCGLGCVYTCGLAAWYAFGPGRARLLAKFSAKKTYSDRRVGLGRAQLLAGDRIIYFF